MVTTEPLVRERARTPRDQLLAVVRQLHVERSLRVGIDDPKISVVHEQLAESEFAAPKVDEVVIGGVGPDVVPKY